MEVYDLTGDRVVLTKEDAEKISATIVENASTLKKVVLKTKTYTAEVARIIGGFVYEYDYQCRCYCSGNRNRRVGFI